MARLNLSLNKYKGSPGFFALNEGGGFTSWEYFTSGQLEEANRHIRDNRLLDSYNSIATFRTPYRNGSNIELLTEHYIDIDNHLSPFTEAQAEQFLNEVLLPVFDIAMPIPSQVVFTGRGLHLHFNLTNARDLIKWQLTQQALLERVQQICYQHNALLEATGLEIDKACTDTARVLRTLGTYNSKAGTYTKLLFEDKKAVYTQEEITSNYGLTYTATRGKAKGKKQPLSKLKDLNKEDILNAQEKLLKEFIVYSPTYTKETLNISRKQDLFKLIEIRNQAGISTGYRNALLSVMVQLIRETNNDLEYLINEALAVNEYFKEPLDSSEVIRWCYSARKKQLYFTDKRIIEKLNLTRQEQEQLSVIVSKSLKNARYYQAHRDSLLHKANARYKPIKLVNTMQRAANRVKARQLKEQGLKAKEIAQDLGISLKTYYRYIKE